MRIVVAIVAAGLSLWSGTAVAQPTVAPGIGPATPPSRSATIRGAVIAADTGAPLRRVQVRAVSMNGQDTRATLTDDQGRFELRELAGGRYNLSAQRSGFVTVSYGQRRPNERGIPIDVAAGAVVDRIAIALPRGGVITGRLSDDAGEPLADAQVVVLRSMFTPAGRRAMPVARPDTTDDQGTFRVHGLPPGEYVVSATVRNSTFGPPGRAGAEIDQGYAPTYYPGTPAAGDAQRISVAAGQEVSGVSFAMTPTRVARVSGRVVGGPAGESGGFVSLMPEDISLGMSGGGGASVRGDGTFEFNGIAPGRYTLRAEPRESRGNDDALVGLASLTVAGADVTGLVIPMQRPGRISGRIEFEGGLPADARPSQVSVSPLPADVSSSRFTVSGQPRVANDFTFVSGGLSMPVLLRASGPPGWSLKGVYLEGDDVTDAALPVGPGANVGGVRVVFTRTRTTLSGVVRDDRGTPTSSAAVVVFPQDEGKLGAASRFLRSTRPDADGRYEVTGLPPYGDYRIVAVDHLEEGQFYDPEFLASLRDRSERLGLAEGETKTLDLRVRP